MNAEVVSEGTVFLYDKELIISVANKRESKHWEKVAYGLSGFVKRLSQPGRTSESYEKYQAMPKEYRETLKSEGGCYIGGLLDGKRRVKNAILGRNIITFDADYIDDVEAFKKAVVRVLGEVAYTLHPTRTSPRIRLLVYPDRVVKPEEYQPLARLIADRIGMQYFDPVSFRLAQLYYWPTVSADSEYWVLHNDMPLLAVGSWLAQYPDGLWADCTLWPSSDLESKALRSEIAGLKAQDPFAKSGLVGAFCRTYPIGEAISKFLAEHYRPDGDGNDRYTYRHGTSVRGAVVYGEGRWLYSNHATDPTSGRLVNSFDLVRIHVFGTLDKPGDDESHPVTALPSYKAMTELCKDDLTIKENYMAEISHAFADMGNVDNEVSSTKNDSGDEQDNVTETELGKREPNKSRTWVKQLQLSDSLKTRTTQLNANLIIANDLMQGEIVYDAFMDRRLRKYPGGRLESWTDSDSVEIQQLLNLKYDADFPMAKVEIGLSYAFLKNTINPLADYLSGLEWDGMQRAATFFIRHLKLDNTPLHRNMTISWLLAAFRRATIPGYKFDVALVFSGKQGIGKSTLLSLLADTPVGNFFGELHHFDDQKAMEQLRGVWIAELPELTVLDKHTLELAKAFLSAKQTRVRMAYGRHEKEFKRKCVFAGTTNNTEILKDATGNRRFWPMESRLGQYQVIDFDTVAKEVPQIWAEVKYWHDNHILYGYETYLNVEQQQSLAVAQEHFKEKSDLEDLVKAWLDEPAYIHRYKDASDPDAEGFIDGDDYAIRDRVHFKEIALECFGYSSLKDIRPADEKRIKAIMAKFSDWERKKDIWFGRRITGTKRGRAAGWLLKE